MENNNGFIIGLLTGVIISLFIVTVLFAANKINFTSEKQINNSNNSSNNENINNNNDKTIELLKEKYNYVEKNYIGYPQNPCNKISGTAETTNNIPQKNNLPYYQSNDFHSFEELNQYLLQFMSEEVISLKSTYNKDYYIVKDNTLYCQMLGVGNLVSYNESKTEFNFIQITGSNVEATIIAYYDSGDSNETEYNFKKQIKVTFENKNNNWIITKYVNN